MPELLLDAELDLGPLSLDLRLESTSPSIAVEGPSGAGKSTLLRIFAGLEPSATGSLQVDGIPWMDSTRRIHRPPWDRQIGWVPQDALLFPHRTVRQNLAYAEPDPDELSRVASMLRVEGLLDRRPRNLSGGERQRVALGRALLAAPRLLLLDEPFAALDVDLRVEVATAVRQWCEEPDRGIQVVMVSHDTAAAESLAREHWTLSRGALRLRGDADRGERGGA